MLAKTPLHSAHVIAKAKMVDFHGWEMPLHYGSQINEHLAVRQHAGLFDVSHMTIVDILGAGGRQFLRKLLTNDVDKLKHVGKALYSPMCNQHGGIIDDLIVYQRTPDNYRLVLNSATRKRDLAWIHEAIHGFSADLQERPELAMIAVQGPQAIQKTLAVLEPTQLDAVATLQPFECVDVDQYFFARTGYTGEDGLEIIVPKGKITKLWSDLLANGVIPCGLAARDTLRLEAGMLLYGQDMNETNTPLESGLSWTIAWEPEDRDFIGMRALMFQKQQGLKHKLVGLTLKGKGVMRSGYPVIIDGQPQGIITSGSYSPTLERSIAFARVPVHVCNEVLVDIRGKHHPATVGKLKFISSIKG